MDRITAVNKWSRLLRVVMYLLAAVGLIMVLRRTLVLEHVIPSVNPAGGPPFDGGFARHPFITFLHILPGALFMILGPMQFMPGIRRGNIVFYRRSRNIFIAVSYIVGISALLMSFVISPIGGMNEAAASSFYAIYFLIALSLAWRQMLKGREMLYREWMIRAFAIGLAIATVRPIMALFFAFSGLPPQVFFGTAFWIGFTLHLIAAEIWINYTR